MSVLDEMISKKEAMLPPGTNAYRLADGAPWDGIFIDVLADRLLVSVRDRGISSGLKEALRETGRPVYLKRLDKDVKEAPLHLCGPEKELRLCISENGVKYLMDMAAG